MKRRNYLISNLAFKILNAMYESVAIEREPFFATKRGMSDSWDASYDEILEGFLELERSGHANFFLITKRGIDKIYRWRKFRNINRRCPTLAEINHIQKDERAIIESFPEF